MKRALGRIYGKWAIFSLIIMLLTVSGVWAKPTTPEQAKQMVQNWLSLDGQPLGAFLGPQVQEVETYCGDTGTPVYYVVYLNPNGFVIVPADDLVEPIIGFLPQGRYDPSPVNPLGALVSRDVPGRVLQAREVESQAAAQGLLLEATTPWAVAQRKWAWLENPVSLPGAEFGGLPNISDERVPPLVQSKWSQGKVGTQYCYNYFTPSHYVCGCTATAMAQLMRYHAYPTNGIGKLLKSYQVTDKPASGYTRGGDGNGGPYLWSSMVLDPEKSGVNDAQCQAIGALTYDAGISAAMDYNQNNSGESGAPLDKAAQALVNTFQYSNAKIGSNSGADLPATNRNNMVNASLNAASPVLFHIAASNGEHAIVGDGYGYNASTMYHHLNLGWAGNEDFWYNLPTIPTTNYNFNTIRYCVYNVYKSGTGEIISGRVTDTNGNPLGGATISWTKVAGAPGETVPAAVASTTDGGGPGIWSAIFPPGGTYKFSCTKSGYKFPTVWTVGPIATSTDGTLNTGNAWTVDFVGSAVATKKNIAGAIKLLLLE